MRELVLSVLAIVSFVCSAEAGTLLRVEGRMIRWAPETLGATTVITYSILNSPYTVHSDKNILSPSNCARMHAFRDIVSSSPAVAEEKAKEELEAAFHAWENVANITFVEFSNPSLANIVIGAADDPGGRAFAKLKLHQREGSHPGYDGARQARAAALAIRKRAGRHFCRSYHQAYVCLNPKSKWKASFDGNLDVYDLRHTFTHEVGHAIGLDHPDSSGAVMAFRYDERVRESQPSDIDGVQKLYGARGAAR